ncbi:Glycosyltransferase family 90 [uncultured virus]|nr:Glycosyltransferase family 90 [uncultured virus]
MSDDIVKFLKYKTLRKFQVGLNTHVKFWYGDSYRYVMEGNWKKIAELITKSYLYKNVGYKFSNVLTLDDDTKEKVISKYGTYGEYRSQTNAEIVKEWKELGADPDCIYPVLMVDSVGPNFPGITYNRVNRPGVSYAMTWPLNYHINESRKGLDDTKDFTNKIGKIVFRGSLSGPIKSLNLAGKTVKYGRYVIIEPWINSPWANLGISNIPKESRNHKFFLSNQEQIAKCTKPHMSISQQLDYKYILCLEGADVSSGFGWALSSNSVPIHPYPFNYYVWFHQDLVPYVHFIPIKPDGSDLEQAFIWCETHSKECEMIAKAGRDYITLLLDADNLNAIKIKVVKLWKLKSEHFK